MDDSAIFRVSPSELLTGVRDAASGGSVSGSVTYLLARCGLLESDELSEPGRSLFKLAWVLRRDKDANEALGQAMRRLTPLQVIEQELRGLGPVPEQGVLELLRHHRAVPEGTTIDDMRSTFRWLSSVGVVAYSTKLKSVRSLAPAPDAALAGEVAAIAAMVSPRTPFLNVVRLRRIIRTLKGVVWWADPHFHSRALEELAEELEAGAVTDLRILSGVAENVITDRSLKDFRRFQTEMSGKGVNAEWRMDTRGSRDWHDRWIADDRTAWNVPPINTLFKNDYSEMLPAVERPPLQTWWDRSTSRT